MDETIYLYADGHAVVIRTEKTKRAGTVEYAEVYENWGPRCDFQGRIIFYNRSGLGKHSRKAKNISAREASTENGSDATRKAGIAVGSIFLGFGPGEGFYIYDFPNLLSACYTYQPDVIETFNPDIRVWGTQQVMRVFRKKIAPQKAMEAAAEAAGVDY